MVRCARLAWYVLAFNLLVILWGAYVRATGSGAGCGSHWPLCNGQVLPRSPAAATLVEFTHRATSGAALVAVVALWVWTLRLRPRGDALRRASGAALLFMLGEAALGAALVLFGLVTDNASLTRALVMGLHLLNTFLLLAALALTAERAQRAAVSEVPAPALVPVSRAVLRLAALGLLVVGVSGALAALGDTLFPAGTLAEAVAQDLAPGAHLLLRLRLLHPVLAVVAGLGVFVLGLAAWQPVVPGRVSADPLRRRGRALAVLSIGQLVCGALNVLLLAPVWMQLVHLLLADLLWLTFVLLASAWRAAPAPLPATGVQPVQATA